MENVSPQTLASHIEPAIEKFHATDAADQSKFAKLLITYIKEFANMPVCGHFMFELEWIIWVVFNGSKLAKNIFSLKLFL